MEQKRIVTISREFGSGGRSIGKQLADQLGIKYYDKELVKQVAVETASTPALWRSGVSSPATPAGLPGCWSAPPVRRA